jgi:hypothetical protein
MHYQLQIQNTSILLLINQKENIENEIKTVKI